MMERKEQNTYMNKICRTCLSVNKPDAKLHHFNEICTDTKEKFRKMLLEISYIEIIPDEKLPDEMCEKCAVKAAIAYNFKILCKRSEALLRKTDFEELIKKEDDDGNRYISSLPINLVEDVISSNPNCDSMENDNEMFTIQLVDDEIQECEDKSLLRKALESEKSHPIEIKKTLQKFNTSESEESDGNLTDGDILNGPFEPEAKKLVCRMCQLSFDDIQEFKAHRKTHLESKEFKCHICSKSYSRIYSLELHLVTHTDQKDYLCPKCGKKFHNLCGLRQHVKYHSQIKTSICEICNKGYVNLYKLKEHVRIAHTKNLTNYFCATCNKKFTTRYTLTNHMKIHTGERPIHKCEICNKTFPRAILVKNHMRKHTNEPLERPFLCTYENCEKAFSTKTTLELHIRHIHTKEKPYNCEICQKDFFSSGGLKEHAKTHNSLKPEKCPYCGKEFKFKSSLKIHIRLHTGEKPYKCKQCDECFVSPSRRNEHVIYKHSGRREECHICRKRFHRRCTLKAHILIHTGQKRAQPYVLPQLDNSTVPIVVDSKQKVPEPGFEVVV